LPIRTTLYAATAKVKIHSMIARPRCRSLRNNATVFSHPKTSSMRLRFT
jgi:ribosomal protein S27E